jgi:hypothetical protein
LWTCGRNYLSFEQRIIVARSYHVEIARFAADADQKWVDNLLSRFDVPGVDSSKQGLSRRISDEGVYYIALIRVLTSDLEVSTAKAVSLAGQLLTVPGSVVVADEIELVFDRLDFQRRIDARIAEAVESIAPARRGRPPKRPAADD